MKLKFKSYSHIVFCENQLFFESLKDKNEVSLPLIIYSIILGGGVKTVLMLACGPFDTLFVNTGVLVSMKNMSKIR